MNNLNYYLDLIDSCISSYLRSEKQIGIVEGESGLLLLLGHLYTKTKEKRYLNQLYDLINQEIDNPNYEYSFIAVRGKLNKKRKS